MRERERERERERTVPSGTNSEKNRVNFYFFRNSLIAGIPAS